MKRKITKSRSKFLARQPVVMSANIHTALTTPAEAGWNVNGTTNTCHMPLLKLIHMQNTSLIFF